MENVINFDGWGIKDEVEALKRNQTESFLTLTLRTNEYFLAWFPESTE